jgi:hypothetical protein
LPTPTPGDERRPRLYRERTTLRTVRIPSDAARVLEQLAASQGVSFNALVNKMVKSYLEFNEYADKLGFVTLPRQTFKSIIESADRTKLEWVGSLAGERVPLEVMLYMYKDANIELFFKHVEKMCRFYRLGTVDILMDGKKSVIAFHHDLGANWTAFLSSYLVQAAKKILGAVPKCEITEELVILRFGSLDRSDLRGEAVAQTERAR